MCHDRNTCLDDGLNAVGILSAAFEFDRLAVGLLDDTAGIHHGIIYRTLIRHKGHVDDYK